MVPFAGYEMPVQYPRRHPRRASAHPRRGRPVRRLAYGAGAPDGRRRRQAAALEALVPGDHPGAGAGPDALHPVHQRAGRHPRRSDGRQHRRSPDAGGQRLAARRPTSRISRRQLSQARVEIEQLSTRALLALQGPRPPRCSAASRRECRRDALHDRGIPDHRRRHLLRHPLRLYRRGRLRDLGARRCRRAARPPPARRAGGEADRPRRPRFAAARGRASASTATTSTRRRRRSRPALAWTIGKRRRGEGGFPGADVILRAARRRRAAPPRRHPPDGRAPARERTPRSPTAPAAASAQVTSGGFGPTVGGPVAMGYVAIGARRAGHRSASSSCATSRAAGAGWRRCRSFRTAITAAEAEDIHEHRASSPRTMNGSGSRATSAPSASPTTRRRSSATSSMSSCRRSARKVEKGKEAAVVESVKAASEVYAPVGGEVVAVNEALSRRPRDGQRRPDGRGLVRQDQAHQPGRARTALMDEAAYRQFVEGLH